MAGKRAGGVDARAGSADSPACRQLQLRPWRPPPSPPPWVALSLHHPMPTHANLQHRWPAGCGRARPVLQRAGEQAPGAGVGAPVTAEAALGAHSALRLAPPRPAPPAPRPCPAPQVEALAQRVAGSVGGLFNAMHLRFENDMGLRAEVGARGRGGALQSERGGARRKAGQGGAGLDTAHVRLGAAREPAAGPNRPSLLPSPPSQLHPASSPALTGAAARLGRPHASSGVWPHRPPVPRLGPALVQRQQQ